MLCPNCHLEVPARNFCTKCGRPLPKPSVTPGASVPPPLASPPPAGAPVPARSPAGGSAPSPSQAGPRDFLLDVKPVPGSDERLPTYLPLAVLATVMCCLPTGLAAVWYATQVPGRLARNDLTGARDASRNAKTWIWVSAAIGIVTLVAGGLMHIMVYGL